jgi:hypothetical protein
MLSPFPRALPLKPLSCQHTLDLVADLAQVDPQCLRVLELALCLCFLNKCLEERLLLEEWL